MEVKKQWEGMMSKEGVRELNATAPVVCPVACAVR